MNVLDSTHKETISELIKSNFYDEKLHPLFYKGIVIQVDDGQNKFKFPSGTYVGIVGALKCRILGLHNYIKDDNDLPIVYPFFQFGGLITSIPQRGDWVWIIFEYIEPVSQSYWLSQISGKTALSETNLQDLYKSLFGK